MTPTLAPAALQDIAELRQLYFDVYGSRYPLPLGSDPAVMRRLIADPHTRWLTARQPDTGQLAGSAVVQTDPGSRIGKLVGLAVHPDHRRSGLAGRLTGAVCGAAFAASPLASVYATVRMNTNGPQQAVVRNGFKPLGLMPNAAEVAGCESLGLFARFDDGVLARRATVAQAPAALSPLLSAAEASTAIPYGSVPLANSQGCAGPAGSAQPPTAHLEVIGAPGFVQRRFLELFPDPAGRYYPLHSPNAVLAPPDGAFEAYVDLDPGTGSCALIAVHPYPEAVTHALEPLMATVSRSGADYVETLLPLSDTASLTAFLAAGFVPSALYPAMRRVGETFHDYVVLSRTGRQIDFRAVALSGPLQPYVNAYLTAWSATYLPRHEVVL